MMRSFTHRSTPALCPAWAGGVGPGPPPAPPRSTPALCPAALSPARACSTWASLLPLPKMGGEEEASLLPSHFGRGRRLLSSPPENGRGGGPLYLALGQQFRYCRPQGLTVQCYLEQK